MFSPQQCEYTSHGEEEGGQRQEWRGLRERNDAVRESTLWLDNGVVGYEWRGNGRLDEMKGAVEQVTSKREVGQIEQERALAQS